MQDPIDSRCRAVPLPIVRGRRRGLLCAVAVTLAVLAAPLHPARAAAVVSGPAPDLTLPGPEGDVSLAELRGKVVYLDFWASWCVPCRASFPWMDDLAARHRDAGLEIVAINLDENPEDAARFLEEFAPSFRIAFDPSADSAERYGVLGMPSSWLIDADGSVLFSHVGFRERDKADIEARIEAVLERVPEPTIAAATESSS